MHHGRIADSFATGPPARVTYDALFSNVAENLSGAETILLVDNDDHLRSQVQRVLEGFGYQVLEAMASGAPVVASDVSSIPELTGDAALLCPPGSVEGFADALTRVLSDPALAQDLRTRGLERARHFTWGRTAEELRAGLAELA